VTAATVAGRSVVRSDGAEGAKANRSRVTSTQTEDRSRATSTKTGDRSRATSTKTGDRSRATSTKTGDWSVADASRRVQGETMNFARRSIRRKRRRRAHPSVIGLVTLADGPLRRRFPPFYTAAAFVYYRISPSPPCPLLARKRVRVRLHRRKIIRLHISDDRHPANHNRIVVVNNDSRPPNSAPCEYC